MIKTDKLKVDEVIKSNGSGLYAKEDGGTIYHITKWFTPTGTFSSVGTAVTTTGGQLTAAMVGAKIGVGNDKRVILTVPTSNTCTVESAFSQEYSSVAVDDWGVYCYREKVIFDGMEYSTRIHTSSGNPYFYKSYDRIVFTSKISNSDNNGRLIFYEKDILRLASNQSISWVEGFTTQGNSNGTEKSFELEKASSGELAIYGTNRGDLRDIKARKARFGNVLSTQLTTATTGASISSIAVDHTTKFAATGTFTVGTTTIAYTSKTATSLVFAAQVVPAYAIGTRVDAGGDYVEIDENGKFWLRGNATVWDDEASDAVSLLQTGAGVSLNVAECRVGYTTGANLSDYMIKVPQMKHKWKLASKIYPHIHFEQTTAACPNWLLQYRWQVNGAAKTTAWTNLACNTLALPYTSGTINQIAYVNGGLTPPAGAMLSDIIEFRILRDNANTSGVFAGADPVAATASIKSFDFHFEQDSLGSNDEYIK